MWILFDEKVPRDVQEAEGPIHLEARSPSGSDRSLSEVEAAVFLHVVL